MSPKKRAAKKAPKQEGQMQLEQLDMTKKIKRLHTLQRQIETCDNTITEHSDVVKAAKETKKELVQKLAEAINTLEQEELEPVAKSDNHDAPKLPE